MNDPARFVTVTRETIWNGVLPWAGPEYEARVRKLIRDSPLDPRVYLVREDLMDVYRQHAPVSSRLTKAEARLLGLETSDADRPNSFMRRLRRALGNPDA